MKADFSGYATKAGLRCTDGRTIMPHAFKHQDQTQVPLVWQHGHTDPENVLGHGILENRDDGVYVYGFFNKSAKAAHAKGLLEHKDINMLSIWANELIQKGGRVLHGAIREVSLVLSGANPGAVIESVTIQHSDGEQQELEDEAIIYTGEELEHSTEFETDLSLEPDEDETGSTPPVEDPDQIIETMTDPQKKLMHSLLEKIFDEETQVEHADLGPDATVEDVYNSMSEVQKDVLHYMLSEAMDAAEAAKHDNLDTDKEGNTNMTRNVFEDKGSAPAPVISHADIEGIMADATKGGSLKDAMETYALQHSITDIDVLFPEPEAIDAIPEFLARRTEWVDKVFGQARKSPFSRIKTLHADITMDEARAKGYVTGEMKREEFFAVSKRVTTPTTVYKKQKLDRDDMVDITDFDVVAWLKGEMRLMLDEEVARAMLFGDGRDISHEDKINEQSIRPVATDHELYTTVINVNLDDANSSVQEIIDSLILNRRHYKGSGIPTMFTTETYIAMFLLLKDTLGRRIYKNLDELATELRFKEIVPVEAMEEQEDIVAVIYNPADYVVGATAGGKIGMFDDFDIDYNQHKYLIETRMCGALTKLKSAMVVKKVEGTLILVSPTAPTFDAVNGEVTITDTANVVYKDGADVVINNAGSPYAVAAGETYVVNATPATGYYFATSEDDSWSFSMPAA